MVNGEKVKASDVNPAFLTDYSAYIEGVYKTEWMDILTGGRFDYYNKYGTNFAPRIALTKQLDKFHYKLLYTHAFHAPTLGNYNLNQVYNERTPGKYYQNIVPEKTYNYEMELGYAFSNNLEVVGNVFYTEITDIVTFQLDKNFNGFYSNAKGLGTYGVESEIRYKNPLLGRFDFGYSFYQSARNTLPTNYQVTDTNGNVLYPNMNLGFPTHKITLNHTFHFTQNFSFNHNIVFMSDRFGYSGTNLTHYSPEWIYNTYLRYQNMPIKGAEIGLGLYDVFNARYQYVQQANGAHPALPAEARELMLRLSYQF
jgi:outer membrane receptor for ferrienterochelin and colicin